MPPDGPARRRAEEIRLRYRYRTLILRGQLRLPRAAAVALVGPDCAYHLYHLRDPQHDGRQGGHRAPPG